jgi:hypothetical protein
VDGRIWAKQPRVRQLLGAVMIHPARKP